MSGAPNGGDVPSTPTEPMVGPRYYTLDQQLAMFEALVAAKCSRFMMATCVSAHYLMPDEWCLVCTVLDDLGYEPFVLSSGGLESWRRKAE